MRTLLNLLHLSTALLSTQAVSRTNIQMGHRKTHHVAQSKGWTEVPGFDNATVRYREVPPGICELQPGVKSYSGYVDVAEDVHMFFWFFEARNVNPANAPLTAWISGGPGASSMSELFTEHGPCRVRPDNKTIVYNPFSWNNNSNVIYIDQPVQVGFSYTDLVPAYLNADEDEIIELEQDEEPPDDATISGNFSRPDPSTTANSTIAAAPNFWLTLQSFMAVFPQYSNNAFNFGSESYGGHYVPIFSKYILDQNAREIPGTTHINLTSILIGNGWFSPTLQMESYYTFGFSPGNTYDIPPPSNTIKTQVHTALYGKGKGLDRLRHCNATGKNKDCTSTDHYCLDKIQSPWTTATGRDNNDIRQLDPSPFPNEFYAAYLQLPHVRAAIGAQQTYIEENPTVGIAFDSTGDDARDLDIIEILRDLIDRGISVTLYAGDADYECNWFGVESVADAIGMQVPGYTVSAGYTDLRTPDHIVHGQVKQAGLFSFVRVYQAGHAVGAFQPLALLEIFERTSAGVDVATGTVDVRVREDEKPYVSVGTSKSTYREGNATVVYEDWPDNSTYDYVRNIPTLEDFQPFWNGTVGL